MSLVVSSLYTLQGDKSQPQAIQTYWVEEKVVPKDVSTALKRLELCGVVLPTIFVREALTGDESEEYATVHAFMNVVCCNPGNGFEVTGGSRVDVEPCKHAYVIHVDQTTPY